MGTNKLKSLPNSLFSLKNLKFLDISFNQIGCEGNGYLSEAIAEASHLVELRAGGNMIITLPESIGDLKQLEVLDLRENRIQSLPERFGLLQRLSKLNLDGNQLQEVPI